MLRYRITLTTGPNAGHSTTAELNDAAAQQHRDRGYHLEALGKSGISERVDAVRTVAELFAKDDIADDEYHAAVALMTRHKIDARDLKGFWSGA
jgi:hypothetical protein